MERSKFSNESRIIQYQTGIPKILSHPFGHGIGMGGEALNFVDSTGFKTIDSYYLMIALEYGIIGFAIYYGMIALSIWHAGRYSFFHKRPPTREEALLVPLMVSLLNFLVIKSVFSQQDNHPLIFMEMGMIVALTWRMRNASDLHMMDAAEMKPRLCPRRPSLTAIENSP